MKTAQVNLALLRGYMKHGLMTKIAQKLNLHPNTLSRKLRGDRSMTIDELNAIAKALRIGVDEFIAFEEDEDEAIEDDNPLSIARFEEAMQEVRQGFDKLGYTKVNALRLIAKVRKERKEERAAKETDDMFLDAAYAGKARYIISWAKDLLTIGDFKGIKIVNPGEFLEIYERRRDGETPLHWWA